MYNCTIKYVMAIAAYSYLLWMMNILLHSREQLRQMRKIEMDF